MKIEIKRTYLNEGTNGSLFIDGKEFCKTIELPWRGNAIGASSIPEGTYELTARFSPKFKAHLILNNVPHRDLILIHPANNAKLELRGCIAPVTTLTGPGRGNDSRRKFDPLIALVYAEFKVGEKVYLTITKNPV